MQRLAFALGLLSTLAWSRPAVAAAQCSDPLEGARCLTNADCGSPGLVCVEDQCRYPCSTGAAPEPARCSLGETCVPGEGAMSTVYYCRPTPFAMDLNLLDTCLAYFADGVAPVLSPSDTCSLERRLNRLLDQTGDGRFNIFDVDGCIRAYFYRPRCGATGQASCDAGQTFCERDAQCGEGLFCDASRNSCQRECGFMASREPNSPPAIERECHGYLKACNYNRGRCEGIDVEGLSCQIESDCPSGAYCFVGKCAPRCGRSLDCPDSSWMCTTAGRCEPVPRPSSPGGAFDPKAYAVRFAERSVALTPVQDAYALALAIMDIETRREVTQDPTVSFGYRLELTDTHKLSPKCQGKVAEADKRDCAVVDFVTLLRPFGTIYADERPFVPIQLDQRAFGQLTPGLYQATLTAIFSNGGTDSMTVTLNKTTVSGTYAGRLSIYVSDSSELLGNTTLSVDLDVPTEGPLTTWNALLARENVRPDLFDTTEGYEVRGAIAAGNSVVFDRPGARTRRENVLPVRGLYSPALGRLRLIAVVDLPAGTCVADSGACGDPQTGAWERLEMENVFGRSVRRVIELIGPFDPRLRRFHGIYREMLTGLAPFEITLDGGFDLTQVVTGAPENVPQGKLIPDVCGAGPCPEVAFSEAEALEQVDDEIGEYCADFPEAAAVVASPATFAAYLQGVSCPPEGACQRRGGRVLDELFQLGARIATLVANTRQQGASLTIYDYLREQNVFCPDAGSPPSLCVSEVKLRCGLAVYRKAMLGKLVSADSLAGAEHQLFCDDAAATPNADCLRSGDEAPALVTLQEHGRFYSPLALVRRFTAGAELSDALFVMFRAQDDPLVQASALAEKERRLHAAWRQYQALRRDLFSTASTAVLFGWPMSQFRGRGADWLAQIHTVLRDRRDLLDSLVDLKRRIYASASEQDFVFVQHLFHEEYLTEVLLIWLQREWQGEAFHYQGTGPEMLERAQMTLARTNETRNPLGFHADRVFFENDDLQLSNWERYRSILGRLGPGETGLLAQVEAATETAVAEMQASLSSKTSLDTRIRDARYQFRQTVDSLCGPPLPLTSKACETRNANAAEMDYVCEDDACSEVMAVFDGAVANVGDVACRADRSAYALEVDGAARPCVRGQMGTLLQEKVQLELQRQQLSRKLKVLLRQIDAQATYIAETQASHLELVDYLGENAAKMRQLQAGLEATQYLYEVATATSSSQDCFVILGMANGTNCLGKALSVAMRLTALTAKRGVDRFLHDQQAKVAQGKEIRLTKESHDATLRQQRLTLENLQAEVENLVSQYETVTQQLFNLMMRLDDTHFLAKTAAAQYQEVLGDITESLVGTQPASLLRRNAKAQEAEQKFLQALRIAYKMAMAFSHRYNLRDEAETLVAKVFRLMTPRDVSSFIDELDAYERSYCAVTGIDCDAQHNIAYYRFSLRDELFPTLTDIVDAKTGKVLTRGEQFHALITSSMFRSKRKLGSQLVEQIELPFAIWLNDRRGQSGIVKPYMLSPLECNHTIAGEGQGTYAVNVIGTRLSRNLRYELWRGNADSIRACESKEVTPVEGGLPRTEYPIHTFLVGYAPESALGQLDGEQRFVTHTGDEVACRNIPEGNLGFVTDESCYNFFARDRSLAAPDWRLVIPLAGSGLDNEWVLGEGVSAAERPFIEDIVLYIRHRKRPIVR